jgi:hypothetical protein
VKLWRRSKRLAYRIEALRIARESGSLCKCAIN